jgi:phosphoinositide-3-kinase regulatory subunit 4
MQELVLALMSDPESIVKRAIVPAMPELCLFFGRQRANDALLSHLITYLNDRDWQLRWCV